VWNEAPDNRRNLYVVYDWQYLVEDGEVTEEEWCFNDNQVLTSAADYVELCEAQDNAESCAMYGCKKFKENKGTCLPEKKKINCKKLGPEDAEKNAESRKEICDMFLSIGCSWNEKKGCKGKVNLSKL